MAKQYYRIIKFHRPDAYRGSNTEGQIVESDNLGQSDYNPKYLTGYITTVIPTGFPQESQRFFNSYVICMDAERIPKKEFGRLWKEYGQGYDMD